MDRVEGRLAERAAASGLVSQSDLARCRAEVGETADDQRVLAWLVEQRLLTRRQAAQLKAGQTQNLVLGHYKLLAPLGAGGMGAVFRALDARLAREVAVKVLPPSAATPEAVGRFRREALAALELRHDHVVASFELAQQGSIHYLVMELVDGPSLAAHLAKNERLSVRETARIGYEVALALEHARRQGIVHRDIKPSNILLSRQGKVKLADLGLAKFFGPQSKSGGPETRTGQFMGTIDYCAPEQAQDAKRADIRSDIYALGCTLYHCLTGKPPFPDGTEVERIMAHIELLPAEIRSKNRDVPPALAELIERRMLAKQPSDRFQTPAEAAEALAPWATGQAGATDNPWAALSSGLESLLDEAVPRAAQRGLDTTPGRGRATRRSARRRAGMGYRMLTRPWGYATAVVVLLAVCAARFLWSRSNDEGQMAAANVLGAGDTAISAAPAPAPAAGNVHVAFEGRWLLYFGLERRDIRIEPGGKVDFHVPYAEVPWHGRLNRDGDETVLLRDGKPLMRLKREGGMLLARTIEPTPDFPGKVTGTGIGARIEAIDDPEPTEPETPHKPAGDAWAGFHLHGNLVVDGFARLTEMGLSTRESYAGPLDITLTARTNKNNIRLFAYGAAAVIFNWELNLNELRVHRPDGVGAACGYTPLKRDTWYRLRWKITDKSIEVYVNDRLVFDERGDYNLGTANPVWVPGGMDGSTVDVKSLTVARLEADHK